MTTQTYTPEQLAEILAEAQDEARRLNWPYPTVIAECPEDCAAYFVGVDAADLDACLADHANSHPKVDEDPEPTGQCAACGLFTYPGDPPHVCDLDDGLDDRRDAIIASIAMEVAAQLSELSDDTTTLCLTEADVAFADDFRKELSDAFDGWVEAWELRQDEPTDVVDVAEAEVTRRRAELDAAQGRLHAAQVDACPFKAGDVVEALFYGRDHSWHEAIVRVPRLSPYGSWHVSPRKKDGGWFKATRRAREVRAPEPKGEVTP